MSLIGFEPDACRATMRRLQVAGRPEMPSALRLALAIVAAVAAGAVAGGFTLGVLLPDVPFHPLDLSWWLGCIGYGAAFLSYTLLVALAPGLVLHSEALKVGRTKLWHYVGAAAAMAMLLCVVARLLLLSWGWVWPIFGYILVSVPAGAAAFWIVRRPDAGARPS